MRTRSKPKDDANSERGVSIVAIEDSTDSSSSTSSDTNTDSAHINAPNDENNMAALNPQLVAALKKLNDDPSYLQPKDGEVVDLSQFEMAPERLEEMIEIFDWIESQLPKDDPQQIQQLLNNVANHIADINSSIGNSNYTQDSLLRDLTVLPEFLYQVDNGVDFMKMQGIAVLLSAYNVYNPIKQHAQSLRNVTLSHNILSQIMAVIGVATQNNARAIQFAHEAQLVPFIVAELRSMTSKPHRAHINAAIVNKLLFTLAAITRQSGTGLKQLKDTNGADVLFECGKILSTQMFVKQDRNLHRALKKLLTMVSDIVVLHANNVENGDIFVATARWCEFMVDKGLLFEPETVLQFVDYALQRNYCVQPHIVRSLRQKLHTIVKEQEQTRVVDGSSEEEENVDESLMTQSSNMLAFLEQNFDINSADASKTEL